MADIKIDAVRSSSSGILGRALSEARGHRVALDSSSRPAGRRPDQQRGLSRRRVVVRRHADRDAREGDRRTAHGIQVTIEGARSAAEPNRFASVSMTFEIAGVSQTQADELCKTYRGR
jgi:hypothetical protein